MKLVIIEGMDRCGKDSIIDLISQDHFIHSITHWGYPVGNTNEEKTEWQKTSFLDYMSKWKNVQSNSLDSLVVWNRAHVGEYVYGTMYRDSYPDTWIPDLEEKYLSDDNVYLVLLHADPEFLLKHDDGNSYTTQLELEKLEHEKFQTAFDSSTIKNKIKIKVSHGDNYSDINDIYSIIVEAISI